MQKQDMEKLEKLLEQKLESASSEEAEYIRELLRVVRFTSASKYYHHI